MNNKQQQQNTELLIHEHLYSASKQQKDNI